MIGRVGDEDRRFSLGQSVESEMALGVRLCLGSRRGIARVKDGGIGHRPPLLVDHAPFHAYQPPQREHDLKMVARRRIDRSRSAPQDNPWPGP